ncbi:MAG: GFA family protein [Pseudomonadota bacterium]
MTVNDANFSAAGGCTCGRVRFKLTRQPLFVHACHCRLCQRQSGTAFALNGLIEANHVVHESGELEEVTLPTGSGKGQTVSRCPHCRIAVWSIYNRLGGALRFIRIGALDEPDTCPPDIHIFTSSKQSWVKIPDDAVAVPETYDQAQYWPAASLERRDAAISQAS